MEDSKKEDFWSDRETRTMLSIVHQKHLRQLRVGATKRNRAIFEDIASELRKKNIPKSHVQVRNKFKSLKSDFFKAKRKSRSGAKQQSLEHFELLDELFGSSTGSIAVKAEGIDVIEMDCENTSLSQSPSVSDSQEPSQPNQSAEETSLENEPDETKHCSFKRAEKESYQNAMKSFTKERKESQKELLQNIKEHVQNLMDQQKKHQEELLTKTMETLEKILKKDREETAKMLQGFLTAMQPTQATIPFTNQSTFVEPSSSNSTSLLMPKLSPRDDD